MEQTKKDNYFQFVNQNLLVTPHTLGISLYHQMFTFGIYPKTDPELL